MFDLTGKIALVTGASRGLGWAMAQALATAGAHVALNGRDGKALAARVDELQSSGRSAESCAFDVTDAQAAEHTIAELARRHGRFDILVANAGINHRAPITEFELEDYRRVVETNQTSVWVLAGRWGRVEEIGPAAVFLASDEASFVNGLIMTVDGAFTSAM